MKTRLAVIAFALAALFVLENHSRADGPGDSPLIPLNQDHSGSLEGTASGFPQVGMGVYQSGSTAELLGGHSVAIQMHVVGSGRRAAIAIYDSAGALLGATAGLQEKAATLKIDELAYTGKYTVVVASDRIGDYTMRVESDEHETVDSVQAKIDALKQQLADLEEKLKSLQGK